MDISHNRISVDMVKSVLSGSAVMPMPVEPPNVSRAPPGHNYQICTCLRSKRRETSMPHFGSVLMTLTMAKPDLRLFSRAMLIAAGILVTLPAQTTWCQTTRTIKVVVPYAPGGGADAFARILADQIGRTRGATMVIENRPGAGTVIATEAVARAAPDGSTLLIADSNFLFMSHVRKLSYD